MAELIIERASGERIEINLADGAAVPQIRQGDQVRIVLPDGQTVRPRIDGDDIIISLPASADSAAQTITFEKLALYLADSETGLTVVDRQTGDTVEYANPAQVLSAIEPAAGPETPGSDGADSAPRDGGFRSTSFSDNDITADPLRPIEARNDDDGDDTTLLQKILGDDAIEIVSDIELAADLNDLLDGEFGDEDEETAFLREIFDSLDLDDDDDGIDVDFDDDDTADGTGGSATGSLSVTGQAIDGYIVGATVFADADEDGILDSGEAFTTTGANGEFTLTGGNGPLVLTGGTDVSTGEAFRGTLTAPEGSTVVTPLTTIIHALVEAGSAADTDAAEAVVKSAFGLSGDIDLTSFDPVGGTVDGTAGAEAVLAAGIQVQNTAVQAGSVLNGASGSDHDTTTDVVYDALAARIASNSSGFDIADATLVQNVINDAAADSTLGLDGTALAQIGQAAASAATVITDGHDLIAAQLSGGSGGTAFLTELAKVASVAQNDAADELQTALSNVRGTGNVPDLSTATTNYAGTSLQTAVDSTTAGAVGRATVLTDGDDTFVDGASAGASVIDGGAGDDDISGAGGNDRLIGGEGDDTLRGGAGSDTLSGGGGNDTFVISPGEQIDTIEDFTAGDTLDMSAYVTADNGRAVISLAQNGANTLVQVGGVTQAVVNGKAPADLWVANDGTITINEAPVPVTVAVTGADEDSPLSGQLVATDANPDTTLTFAIVTQPSAGSITVTNATTGAFTFDPAGAFEALGAGDVVTRSFTYSVFDGNSTVQRTATISVDGINDAPVATTTTAAATENTVLTAQLGATDADANDTASFAVVTAPAKGTLSLGASGIYTFDPGSDFDSLAAGVTEDVTFVYSVTDGEGATDTQTVTITVTGTNDAPVVTSQTPTTSEDATVSGDLTTWVVDADSDTLTFALVTPPANGILTIAGNGAYSFNPNGDFQGLDDGEQSLQTFTYTVSDGTVTVQRTANIIVTGENDAPNGITTAVSAAEDTVLSGTLQASDVDIEALNFAVDTAPAKGTLTLNANGTFSFDPGSEFNGLDTGETENVTFVYSVTDGTTTTLQTVTVTVSGANDAPVPTTATIAATEDGTVTSGNLAATDVDGETLTFALVSQPAIGALTINADGSYSYNPGTAFQNLQAGDSTELSFVYSVSDGTATVNKTATLTVSGANDAPTSFSIAAGDAAVSVDRVVQAGTVVGRVQNIVDADAGDTHTIQLTGDAGGRFALDATTGEIVVASGATFPANSYDITLQVTDSQGEAVSRSFTVDVNNVINGNSADGYIQGATVFGDTDGDRVLDAGEASGTTDVEGNYRVTGATGDLVMIGGTDVSTALAFEGILIAPEGASVITPLTSLIATMVNDSNAANNAAAETSLAAALGITASLSSALSGSGASSLLHLDPVAQSVAGVTGALDVMGAGVKVQNTVDIMASALVGADSVTFITATQAVFSAMSSAMSVGSPFAGLTNTAAIEAILNAAATGAGLGTSAATAVADAADEVAQIVTDSNSNVDTVLADTSLTETQALTQLAQASVVAQGAASDAIEAALAGTGNLATTVTSFTGTNLDNAEDAATVGDVNGNDAPVAVTSSLTVSVDEDADGSTLAGTLQATDAEGDALTFSLDSAAGKGTATVNANGTFTYVPDAAQDALAAGATTTDTFDISITDGIDTITETVTVTILGTNDAPMAVDATVQADEDTTFTGAVSATDIDTAAASLAFSLDTPPAKGNLTFNADGSYSFDPNGAFDSLAAGATENVTFSYTVSDGQGGTDTGTETITVTGTNDAPVAAAEGVASTDSATVAGQLDATDVDGDSLTFARLSDTPLGSIAIASDGSYTFDPGSDFAALGDGETDQVTFSYTVTDGTVTVTQTGTVTVTGGNDAPVAVTSGIPASEDNTVIGNLVASDADSTNLTFALVTGPASGSLTINADGSYSFDPGGAFEALDDTETQVLGFTYSVSDGTSTVNQAATITVTGANDAPVVAADPTIAASENGVLNGSLAGTASDVDVETLTFALTSAPGTGTLTISPDGSYSFTPGTAFDALAANATQDVSFGYSVTDDTATVIRTGTITVTGANDSPVTSTAIADQTTPEDTAFAYDASANFADADTGDTLTYSATLAGGAALPAWLSIDSSTGVLSGTPANGDVGDLSVTVTATDGANASTSDTFALTVTDVNDVPVATTTSAGTSENAVLNGTLQATDIDSPTLTFALVPNSGPSKGTVNVATDGTFSFDPGTAFDTLAAGQSENVKFAYSVSDGEGGQSLQLVTVTVSGTNDGPVAVADTASATESGTAIAINVLVNDTDIDSNEDASTLKVVAATAASGATVVFTGGAGDGIAYAPSTTAAFESLAVGETATDTITYTIEDSAGAQSSSTVTVTITGTNDAPTVSGAETASASEDAAAFTVDLLGNASDADTSDTLAVDGLTLISGDAAGVTVNATTLTVDPNAYTALAVGETQSIAYSYDVIDGNGGRTPQTATITITGANDGPVAAADFNDVFKGDTLTVAAASGVLANDTDPDAPDTLSVSAFDATSSLGATVTVNADGSYVYDPSPSTALAALGTGEVAFDSFTYTASDGKGGTTTGSVTVTVSGSTTTGDAIVLGTDSILRVDADQLSVTELDLSGFTVDVVMQSLGLLTRIVTDASQNVEIDAADLNPISEADGTLTIAGNGSVDVTGAQLSVSADGSAAPDVLNLLALEFEGLSGSKSIVPDRLTVDGSHTDAITAFWIQLDQLYVGASDFYNLAINTSFVYLGNDYVRYLEAGGSALLDLVKVPSGRQQTLHDNLLGNLGDGPIASRFTNLGEPDPRTDEAVAGDYGDRPYHAGRITDGVYSDVNGLAGVLGWDKANGINLPDALPAPYAVIDTANTITGTTGDDILFAGGGADTITWDIGDGNDTVDGGADTDLFQINGNASTNVYTITAGTGTIGVAVDENGDAVTDATSTLSNVEDIEINTGAGADTVTISGDFTGTGLDTSTITVNGGDGGITVDASALTSAHSVNATGGAGADSFLSGAGNDSFDGSAGTDTVTFAGSFAAANLSFTSGTFAYDNSANGQGNDSLVNVEVLSFQGDAGARVLLVGGGGFTSIQDALTAAADGDTIYVAPGTYSLTETLVIDKSVTLLGNQAGIDPRSDAGLRIEGSGDESIIDGGGTLATLIRIAADNVTIDGFDIGNGTGDLVESQITVANPVVRYNFVHDSTGDEGMQIRNASDAVVEFNHVSDTAGDAINLSGSSANGIVRFNEVHDTSSANAAIYLDGAVNTTVQGNLLYDIANNDGIKFGDKGGSNAADTGGQAIDNVIRNSVEDGIAVYMSNVTVSGNDISGSTSENGAVFVDFNVDNVTISNNTIHDNGNATDSDVTFGIRVGKDAAPTNVTVTGNTLTNNEAQMFARDGSVTNEATLAADNTVDTTATVGVTYTVGAFAVPTAPTEFATIQEAVNAASPGDTILIAAGTYTESVTVDKALNFVGQGSGRTIITPASGNGFTLTGDLGAANTVSFDGIAVTGAAGSGIVASDVTLGTLRVTDSHFEQNDVNGFRVINTANGTAQTDLANVVITDTAFTENGQPAASSGDGDLIFFQHNGNVTLQNLTLDGGSRTIGGAIGTDGAGENGIQFRGDNGALGTVVMDNVDIGGNYEKVGIAFYNYDNVDGLSMSDVNVTASTGWQLSFNFDGIGGDIDFSQFTNVVYSQIAALQGEALSTVNRFTGGDGSDFVRARAGADVIDGGGGNDTIVWSAGDGSDFIDGGAGTDLFRATGNDSNNTFDVTAAGGSLTVAVDEDGDGLADATTRTSNVEDIEINTGAGADTVTISGDFTSTGLATSTITVNGGDDGITVDASGLTSAHSVNATGGAGADSFLSGTGNDSFDGGVGSDTVTLAGSFVAGDLSFSSGAFSYDNSANGQGTNSLVNVEALSFQGDAGARVLLVGGGGFATIQDAVDAAAAGDTIFVAPGTYTGDLTINKQVTLLGAQSGVDARGRTGQAETIIDGRVTVSGSGDNVTVDGFTVLDGGSIGGGGENAGIYLASGAAGTTITNTVFTRTGVVDGDTFRGILTTFNGGNTDLSVSQNSFAGWATGVYLNPGATDAQITDNDFDGNFVGMSIDGPSNTTVSGNTFANNLFEGLGVGPGAASPALTLANNAFDANTTHIGVYTDIEIDASTNSFSGIAATALTNAQAAAVAALIGDSADDSFYSGVVHLQPDTIFVGAGGSIQAAIDAASAGDTIIVGAGSYAPFGTSFGGVENLTILTTDGAVIDGSGLTSPARVVDLRADGTTLSGFTITGPGADAGVFVGVSVSGRGVTVQDNTISDTLTGIQTTTQYAAGNNTITGNTVTTNYGISLQNTGNTVSNNTVNAAVEGVGLLPGANAFTDNIFTVAATAEGLALYAGAVAADLTNSGNTVTVGAAATLQNAADLAGAAGTLNIGTGDYGGETVTVTAEGLTVDADAGAANLDIALGTGVQDITLKGDAGLTVTGNGSDNTVNAAGTGADDLSGGAGTDTVSYFLETAGITIDLSAATATDGSGSTDSLSGFENVVGTGFIDVIGGDSGDNVITGGDGADTLTGNGGNDTFVIGSGDEGTDIITDFSVGDVLQLGDLLEGIAGDQISFAEVGGDTEVRNTADSVTTTVAVIENIAPASLSLDDAGNVTMSPVI